MDKKKISEFRNFLSAYFSGYNKGLRFTNTTMTLVSFNQVKHLNLARIAEQLELDVNSNIFNFIIGYKYTGYKNNRKEMIKRLKYLLIVIDFNELEVFLDKSINKNTELDTPEKKFNASKNFYNKIK